MSNLKWGILATGWIAGMFTKDLLENGHVISAVGSRSLESAKQFATTHGIAGAHGTYEALAGDPDVDIIYIATPHPAHLSAAELCIRTGKHVLIEKPITLNAAEAQRLAELSAQHGVVVMEAMWTRFLPHMISLRQALSDGRIGEIRSLLATHTQDLPDDPGHRLNDLKLGGGALLDLGIYPLSFAFDILGKPQSVLASGRLRETGADAETSLMLRYPGGASALLLCASDAPGANRAEINGTAGHVEIDGVWYSPTSYRIYDSEKNLLEEFEPASFAGRGMHFQVAALEETITSGARENALMPLSQSVEIMNTMDEARRQIGVVYLGEV